MSIHQFQASLLFSILLAACSASPSVTPAMALQNLPIQTLSQTATAISTHTPSQTTTATPTQSPTRTLTPTEVPLTIVFYGDSVLKVGDVSRQAGVGYSIIDILRPHLRPVDQVVTSNHGGRKAKWGYENLDENVLVYNPDLVTLWWGLNDLGGCPGIFDRETRRILQYKLDVMLGEHLKYMKLQIGALLDRNISVIIITPIPILSTLPWSHFDENNDLVWENDYRCDFNIGLEQLVEAQRRLVADYEIERKPVHLVDAWQIYKDHPNSDNMYMDIVHPGSLGAELIAEGWLQVFQSLKK
jgi:lysophospholipase L1-like esterase